MLNHKHVIFYFQEECRTHDSGNYRQITNLSLEIDETKPRKIPEERGHIEANSI